MQIGMLWYSNDPQKSIEAKIKEAVEYYRTKYGNIPNICFVHPTMCDPFQTETMDVRTHRSVLPNHFWIGMKE